MYLFLAAALAAIRRHFSNFRPQCGALTDKELLAGLRRHDRAAQRELLRAYGPRLHRLIIRAGFGPEDAEELLHDVLLLACTRVDRFREESSLATWLYRLATNRIYDRWRYNQREKRQAPTESLYRLDDELPRLDLPPAAAEADRYDRAWLAELLQQALSRLPHKQRLAFLLTQEEGLSYDEAAATLELSRNALESLVFRARQQLRRMLQKYYEENYPNRK